MKEFVRFPLSGENYNRLYNRHFVKKSYDFIGWNTKKDGTGYWYPDGCAIYTNDNANDSEINEPKNLYAQWRKKSEKENVEYRQICSQNWHDTDWNGYISSYISKKFDRTKMNVTISADVRVCRVSSLGENSHISSLPRNIIQFVSSSDTLTIDTEKIYNKTETLLSYRSAHGDYIHFVFRQNDKFALIQVDNLTTGEFHTLKIAPFFFTAIYYAFESCIDDWKLWQDNTLLYDMEPVELLTTTHDIVSDTDRDAGTVGLINRVDGSFMAGAMVKEKSFVGSRLYFSKPSDVDSVTITFEPVGDISKGLSIYRLNNETTTPSDLKWTWTLDSTNPTKEIYLNQKDTNRLAINETCYMHFTTSAPVNVSGFIGALVGANLETCDCTYAYQFYRLFAGTKIRTAPIINIGTMTDHCLNECFADCEELIESAPMIWTESIERSACAGMYQNCPKLRTTSLMNRTKTLGEYSLVDMYGNDTTLEETADLTTVEKIGFGACQGMHAGDIALYRKKLNLSDTVVVDGDSWSEYMLDNTAYEKRQNLKERGFKDYDEKIISSWDNSLC